MNFRTDLALELKEGLKDNAKGISFYEEQTEDIKVTTINITTEQGAKALNKPKGKYITLELPCLAYSSDINSIYTHTLKKEIVKLLPKSGSVLVCGVGNTNITADALGPKTATRIFATRHIGKEIAKSIGFDDLRSVSALAPGVLGQTGIEVGEMLLGVINKTKPSAVITVDALASRNLSRLGTTIQLCDTGIVPGSGVGNARFEISRKTLGVPVVSIGVPTVVDGETLVNDLMGEKANDVARESAQMVVTPREIDLLIDRASRLIAHSINCALQPNISEEDLLTIMA